MSGAQRPNISDKDFVLIVVSTFLGAVASVVLQYFLTKANCVETPPPAWFPMEFCVYYSYAFVLFLFAGFCVFAAVFTFGILAVLKVVRA